MKKRIVKLTEQDLEKLVKKIIKEEEMDPNAPEGEEGDGKMSSGVQKKTDKIIDLPVFGQLSKQLKSKNVDEQVEFFMTLLGQFDLKGNFGKILKKAMTAKGLI
jgi:hypothetical protein